MPSLASLLVTESKAAIYARGLSVATALGLDVTSWVAGDPTRSLYHFVSTVLEAVELQVSGYVASGFLDYAAGDWLTLLAAQVFGVTRVDATFAETTVTLTNSGGGIYPISPGDVRVKSSLSGKTYTNATGGTLAGVSTLDLTFVADEAGSGSSAGATEINTMVTAMLGVTCTNATAAVGLDAETNSSLRDRCRAKLGMLSPNGPRDAYNFVVRSSDLTSVTDITRSRTIGNATTGDVMIVVAGASGPVAGGSVTAAQAAVEKWATPIAVTPTVVNSVASPIVVDYDVWLYASVGQTTAAIKAKIQADLEVMFAARPIGGDIIAPSTVGKLYQSLIASTIKASWPNHTFRVVVNSPAIDTALGTDEVATLSSVTGAVHLEVDP